MSRLILFNKPFDVLTQFTDGDNRRTLADFIPIKAVYPAGRLDRDSEGLVLLTDDGSLQAQISNPKFNKPKTYWVQVDGKITDAAIKQLTQGIGLKDGITKPAKARAIAEPSLWDRIPPVRYRKALPTSWLELTITEGRNRQVRRMTAAVGYPTLRLVRHRIGDWSVANIPPGEYRELTVDSPKVEKRPKSPYKGNRHSQSSNRRAR
jgi:23S rRNA pseudouridine2457 synthase